MRRGTKYTEQLLEEARQNSIDLPFSANTGYVNTIESTEEARCPGNIEIEERLRAYMRWNAMAMVVKANRHNPEDGGDLGGHIGSFASLAHMFGAGFNHFWHAESENHGGDCLYIQGHVSPGVYARAYLEGRLTEEQLLNFRQEVDGKGLSSYPHPKLMPEFWQFPTVSMGLGPLMAIYQARFLKYLHARGIANTENRKVWVFCGDGEMDEVESLGAKFIDVPFLTDEEKAQCMPWLQAEIALIKPKVIVPLGRHALGHFFSKLSITAVHGKPQKLNVYCDGVCMEIASLKRRLEVLYKKKFI